MEFSDGFVIGKCGRLSQRAHYSTYRIIYRISSNRSRGVWQLVLF